MTSTMRAEALAIPGRIARALAGQGEVIAAVAGQIRAFAPTGVVTVARGTSDHAADYALRLIARETGLIGASLPPSLVTLGPRALRFEGRLVLALSQSGRSPDLVQTVTAARAGGALTVAVVNAPQSPLADAAERVVAADAGPEHAVAATKSYVLTLLQVARLVAAWAGDDDLARALPALPTALAAGAAADWHPLVDALEDAGSLFVVGRGLAHATAREAALKLKETCRVHAEAVSGAEIMHGPKALLDAVQPLLLCAGPDVPAAVHRATAGELAALTRRLHVLGAVDAGCGLHLRAPPAPAPVLQPLVDIVPFYLAAEALSRRRGLSPDAPRHLRKVTETR
ncbi:MAG: SIS domain-containing protein [Alphaproteobacteria bacterium]